MKKFFIGLALASAAFIAQSADYSPMAFQVFYPCSGNASFCAPRILAQGHIEIDTADKLKKFLKNSPPGKTTVVFDSPGGNLVGGIQLGLLIRQLEFDTAALETVDEEMRGETKVIAANPMCASACSLAFLGGVNRSVEEGARLGVHQFYSSGAQIGDAETQVLMTSIAGYIQLMGVNRRFMDLASLTSAGKMHWLTLSEVKSLQVDNSSPELAAWKISATTSGMPVVSVAQELAPGHRITLLITNLPEGVLIAISNRFAASADTTHYPIGEPANIEFTNNKNLRLKTGNLKNWDSEKEVRQGEKAFIAAVTLGADEVQQLGKFQELYLQDDIPNALRHVQFSTSLSVKNLRNGLQLLSRIRR